MLELALESCFMFLQCLGWRNHFHIRFHLQKQEKLGSLSAMKLKKISRLIILKQSQEEASLFIDRTVIIIYKTTYFDQTF